jgi:hypothetical protein
MYQSSCMKCKKTDARNSNLSLLFSKQCGHKLCVRCHRSYKQQDVMKCIICRKTIKLKDFVDKSPEDQFWERDKVHREYILNK